jgi:hypothetical protein
MNLTWQALLKFYPGTIVPPYPGTIPRSYRAGRAGGINFWMLVAGPGEIRSAMVKYATLSLT